MDMGDIRERLARIETKLDQLVTQEDRLRSVEKKQWYHTGMLALAGALLYKIGIPLHWN